jgi:hypothetical protein
MLYHFHNVFMFMSYEGMIMYEGRLKIWWIHLIAPSRNFVEVRWRSFFRNTFLGKRCISYNAPPTSRKRAAERWSLWNFLLRSSLFMVGKAQKSHGARSELNSLFGLKKVDRWNPIRTSPIQPRSRSMRLLGFSNHEKGAPRQEISNWSAVCSTFSRSGWSVVRNASFAKGGTSKKRPSPHLQKVPTRSNKVSPRTFQTALIYMCRIILIRTHIPNVIRFLSFSQIINTDLNMNIIIHASLGIYNKKIEV